MPEFPRASTQRSLTTRQPEPLRQEAGEDAKMVEAIAKVAGKWDDALTTSQLNAFKANKAIFLADVKSRADNDPDQNNSEKYTKEIDDYSKKALDGMDSRAKNIADLELKTDMGIAKIQVNGTFQKKIINQGVKNLATAIEGYTVDIINAPTVVDQQKKITEAFATIDQNVASNIISPDTGKEEKTKLVEEVRTGIIDRDLYNDPEGFKRQVAKDPTYYNFDGEKEKSDKLTKADSLIKAEIAQRKWETTQINTQGIERLSNAVLDGSASEALVKDMHKKGEIDSETATIFDAMLTKRKYKIPGKTKLEKPKYFIELFDDVLDDETEALEVMKKAGTSYAAGDMKPEQYAYFISQAMKKFKRHKNGGSMGDKVVRGAWKGLKVFAEKISGGKKTDDVMASLGISYSEKLEQGLAPEAAAAQVKSEAIIDKDPAIGNISKEGELRYDKYGNKAIVYPDGTYKEVE